MSKNLTWVIILIVILAIVAISLLAVGTVCTLHVLKKVLRPGIEEVGGCALVYEIDANGLTNEQKKGLSEKMIAVLRRRIDPEGIRNVVWRPLGNTQFEIQLPFAGTTACSKREQYEMALSELLADNDVNIPNNNVTQNPNKLNLSQAQVTLVLESDRPDSPKRAEAIELLKEEFPQSAAKIGKVVSAYDAYYPFRGWLDTPADLQRILKGTGILEFRILPTQGHPDVDPAQMEDYVDTLKTKGPKYASDNNYIWFEVEEPWNWRIGITGQFGDKFYVLASNKKDEVILHAGQDWKLVRASPGQDQMGRSAIDFELDEQGGKLFANVTGNNLEKPLCILLDDVAMSAPMIQSRIYTRGQITGNFTQTEVHDIVSKLNAGSLPAPLIEEPVSVRTILPRSGANAANKSNKGDKNPPEDSCDL